MKMNEMLKRVLSLCLAVLILFTAVPLNAFIVTADAAQTDGLCRHHQVHDANCGYQPGVIGSDCNHKHDEQCQYREGSSGTPCDHQHGGEECGAPVASWPDCVHVCGDGYCDYVADIPGSDCGHHHDESCGEADENGAYPGCTHVSHDGNCGYRDFVPGNPCNHSHGTDVCGEAVHTYPGCTHVCGTGACAFVAAVAPSDCTHVHDAVCGFVETVQEQTCKFVCGACQSMEALLKLYEALPDAASITDQSGEETLSTVENTLKEIEEALQELEEVYPEDAEIFAEDHKDLIANANALPAALENARNGQADAEGEDTAQTALENVVALFEALPKPTDVTYDTTEEEKNVMFASLKTAMDAYEALYMDDPEQAEIFETEYFALLSDAVRLNNILTGAEPIILSNYGYEAGSKNNATITVTDTIGKLVTGATVTVSRSGNTYDVYESGNGQYLFTKNGYGNSQYTITVNKDGYETATVTMNKNSSSASVILAVATVTITVVDENNARINGAAITVTRDGKTYDVTASGNGQYTFIKDAVTSGDAYSIAVSAEGYEGKNTTISGNTTSTTVILSKMEDLSEPRIESFNVYYIASGELPGDYAGSGDAGNYGPGGDNTPLVTIKVDINKLRREYGDQIVYETPASGNQWQVTPKAANGDYTAVATFWDCVWACMETDSQTAFQATGLADMFDGYVLKKQGDGSQHCDGVLKVTPPVYVIELYDNGTRFYNIATEADSRKSQAEVQSEIRTHLGLDITWNSQNWMSGTYWSDGRIYTVTLSYTSDSNQEGNGIWYEKRNDQYYLSTINVTSKAGADGYYTVTYTDGIEGVNVFDPYIVSQQSGETVAAYPYDSKPISRDGYRFTGWVRQRGDGSLLNAEDIAAMKVDSTDITFHAAWELIPTTFTATVKVVLDDRYSMDFQTMMGDDALTLYLSADGTTYVPLERTAQGVYEAQVENGNYKIYYGSGSSYTAIDNRQLVINNQGNSRILNFYSVDYEMNGADSAEVPRSYHHNATQVMVSDVVPAREGYLFAGWQSDEEIPAVYQSGSTLTTSISKPYTLTAQWEKAMDVYVNITINHNTPTGSFNTGDGIHNIVFTVDHKEKTDSDYTEITQESIAWDGKAETAVSGFSATYEENVTRYVSTVPVLTNVPKNMDYTLTTHKTGYGLEGVTTSEDANGNLIIAATLVFAPENVDLTYTVQMDEAAMQLEDKSLWPTAVNLKITYWDRDSQTWTPIFEHANTYERIAIDRETGSGSGQFPVWKMENDGVTPYYYRIEVVSFEVSDGRVIPASAMVGFENVKFTTADERFGAEIQEITDGQRPVSGTWPGAYFDGTQQKGNLAARISVLTHMVSFDINMYSGADRVAGFTVQDKAVHTVSGVLTIPDFTGYTLNIPDAYEGYIFEGWYTKNGENGDWGEQVKVGGTLIDDTTLYAKWKASVTVSGTVYVDGTYQQFNEDGSTTTHVISSASRITTVTVTLRKKGVTGALDTRQITITYPAMTDSLDPQEHHGEGTYEFANLTDNAGYYILQSTPNYSGTYQNEPDSLSSPQNFAEYHASGNTAVLGEDQEAVVNAHLMFDPASFDLTYQVDASEISESFRPLSAEILVTCKTDDRITEPSQWNVITQMVFGNTYKGDVVALTDGTGSGSTSVWRAGIDGRTLYEYGIRVHQVTFGKQMDYAAAPYDVTYTAPAYAVGNGQSQMLLAKLTPKVYKVDYVLGIDSTAVSGMGSATKTHTWSFNTDLSSVVRL